MRSRTGCLTCRKRKLKCDETKPICGQCRRGSRECHPSEGVVFRHQQNASMNGNGEVEETNGQKLGGFYAYKNTFHENSVWVDVPKRVTFVNVTDPYNIEDSPEPEHQNSATPTNAPELDEATAGYFGMPNRQASGLDALSAVAASSMHYLRPSGLSQLDTPHSSNNLNFILNPSGSDGSFGAWTPALDPLLTSPINQDESAVIDHEVAFLLRHHGETTGQWMDLYDLGGYFAHHVPVQALTNPLLRFSACAYAAKQLGRVRGKKAAVGGNVSRQAEMELFPHARAVDWELTGAKYYDKAISLLMNEVSNSSAEKISSNSADSRETSPRGGSRQNNPRDITSRGRRLYISSATNNADETLAAAAILCCYEFLDFAHTAWARHLSGTKSLFDLAEKEGMMPVQSPTMPGALSKRIEPSRGRRSTFWNFARQDFLAAFINECQTRLNTEDLGLWRAAGLQLDNDGFVIPSNTDNSPDVENQNGMSEDMICNALIFLMSKIINYLASGDSIDNVFPQVPGSPTGLIGINQMILLQRWKELEKELEIWHNGLPNTFQPCSRLPPTTNGSIPATSARAIFSEIWYSIPMCAATMQSYHMARTILLINRPHESTARRSTISDRLYSYRAIEREIRYHVYEICGIALGRPEGSVRIHQVQPLFVAGQCLTEDRERRIVLDLLREIENDLGWATNYRVKKLLEEWSWSEG